MRVADNPRAIAQDESVAFNPVLTARGLAAALCLLGFSSTSGTVWMAYLAVGIAMYSVYAGAPFWRLVSLTRCFGLVRRAPYLAAPVAVGLAATPLVDAPYPLLAAAGNIIIMAALAALAGMGLLLTVRGLRALLPVVARSSSAGLDRLRLYAGLLWP